MFHLQTLLNVQKGPNSKRSIKKLKSSLRMEIMPIQIVDLTYFLKECLELICHLTCATIFAVERAQSWPENVNKLFTFQKCNNSNVQLRSEDVYYSQVHILSHQKLPWSPLDLEHLHLYLHLHIHAINIQHDGLVTCISLYLHWHLMATVMSTFILSLLYKESGRQIKKRAGLK